MTLKPLIIAGITSTVMLGLAGCGSNNTPTTNTGVTTAGNATNATGGASFAAASNFPSGSCLLWKPHSEIDGGLVVLVPASMGGATPIIKKENGEIFATGREHTDARGHNKCGGIRYHYIFGRGTGSAFPKNSILNIGSANFKIPNPARRYE